MKQHPIDTLTGLSAVAESIGGAYTNRRAAGDFSFIVIMRGRVMRATCRYVTPVLADIVPANRY